MPIAFAIAALFKTIFLTEALCWYFFSIPAHEMGHAVFSWLGGLFAIPIGAILPMAGFTAISGGEPSGLIAAIDVIALVALAIWAIREKSQFVLIFCFVAALAHHQLYWKTDLQVLHVRISWAGIAGEHWIGALLLIAFYHPLPTQLRWDFFRFLLLIPGAWIFLSAYWTWFQISRHKGNIPWGSFMNGSGDGGGDMQKLVDTGWTAHDIVSSYRWLGNVCLLLIVGHYVYFLVRAARNRLASDVPESS